MLISIVHERFKRTNQWETHFFAVIGINCRILDEKKNRSCTFTLRNYRCRKLCHMSRGSERGREVDFFAFFLQLSSGDRAFTAVRAQLLSNSFLRSCFLTDVTTARGKFRSPPTENISRSRKVSAIKQTRLFEIARNYTTVIKGVAIERDERVTLVVTARDINLPMGVQHSHLAEKNEEFRYKWRVICTP